MVTSVTLVTIYGQTRILYTISRDGLIPKVFHRVNTRTRTPIANTLIVGTGVAIVAALVIVTVFYMLVAVTAVGAQPAAKFTGQEAGLSVILQDVTGKAWPALVLSAGAVISVFSVTLVTIYGQTRILYTISRDGLIPGIFHRVNARTRTPIANTLIVGLGVGLVAALVDSNFLWDMVSMGTLTAFIAVSIAVPVMRRKDKGTADSGGFRVPFGPYVVPALSVISCLGVMTFLSALTFKIFFIWMAAALFVYFAYGLRHSRLNTASRD